MLSLFAVLPAIAFAVASDSNLVARQNSEEAYLTSVCSPNITATTNPVPPCIQIIAIEQGCAPNNTSPLGYLAHAQCMCGGGYFANWLGCLNCQYVHGGRSPQITSAFNTIISSASNALCTGTPTASFAAIFNSIQQSINPGAASATGLTDQFPSQTAVSLYYTATGPQGLGAISGSATAATRTAGAVNTGSIAATSLASAVPTSTGSGAGVRSGSSTSSSTAGAAIITGAFGGFAAVAAGAVAAVL